MSVVRWWVVLPLGWGRGWEAGGPLVYECCEMVVGTSCGLGVGGWGSL